MMSTENGFRDLLQENFYRRRIGAIFAHLLRNGHEATDQIGDLLYTKLTENEITSIEMKEVMEADFLWEADVRKSGEHVVIVLESSLQVEKRDIDRAVARAAILRRIGVNAVSVVGGQVWLEPVISEAKQARVVTIHDEIVDDESWQWRLTQPSPTQESLIHRL